MAKRTGGAGKTSKKRLTKEELLDQLAPRTEEFALPQEAGGGTILLRGISGSQAFEELKGMAGEMDMDRIKRLLLMGIAEPELDLEAVGALGAKSAGLLEQIGNKIMTLSGFYVPGVEAFLTLMEQQKQSSTSASKS